MILAMRTGWTPDVIADLPTAFRENAHWALFAEGYAQRYQDISGVVDRDPPAHLDSREHREFMNNQKSARAALERLTRALFPPDEATDG